jgi:hypothetical protein
MKIKIFQFCATPLLQPWGRWDSHVVGNPSRGFEYSLHSNLALHMKAALPPSSEPCLLRLHRKLVMGPNSTLASVKSSNCKVATNKSLRLPLLSDTVVPLSLKSSSRSRKNLHLHRRVTKTFPTLTLHRSLSCNHANNGNQ